MSMVSLTNNRTDDDDLTLLIEADYDDGAFVSVQVTNVHGDELVDAIITDAVTLARLQEAVTEATKNFNELVDKAREQ